MTQVRQDLPRAELAICIAEVVSAVHTLHGAGADRTDCYLNDDVVHCVMRDSVAREDPNGPSAELAYRRRSGVEGAMRHDLIGAVGDLTGREVIASLDAHRADLDIASEVYILAPRPKPRPPRPTPNQTGPTEPASTAQATASAGLVDLERVHRRSGVRLQRAQDDYARRYPGTVQRERVLASMVKLPEGDPGQHKTRG